MVRPRTRPALTVIQGSLLVRDSLDSAADGDVERDVDVDGDVSTQVERDPREPSLGHYRGSREENAQRLFPDPDPCLSDEEVDAAETATLAVEQGARYLGHREHSAFELRTKLKRKGLPEAAIDSALAMFREQGLQSDVRFAESFVRSRVRRGYGPIRIRQDLVQRGVADPVIEEALTFSADYWLDIAEQAIDKKFGSLTAIREAGRQNDQDGWNKAARFLHNRGFPSDLIYRTLQV